MEGTDFCYVSGKLLDDACFLFMRRKRKKLQLVQTEYE